MTGAEIVPAKPTLRRSLLVRVPVLTLAVLATSIAFTIAEHLYPLLLRILWRDPVALSNHQWWRLFTPLLVQPDPWPWALMVFVVFLVVGTLSECLWTRIGWIALYLLCGLTGEITGYFWEPYNAGMSVAGAGLLGGLAAWMVLHARLWRAKLGGGFIIAGAVILTCASDIHGPPMIVGAFIGAIMMRSTIFRRTPL